MRFWLGLSGCLALAGAGAALTMEGNPPAAGPVPAAQPRAATAWTDVSEADRAGVPRQMQARVILARQTGDSARQASDPPGPAGDQSSATPKPVEPARTAPDIRAVEEARQRAEARVRRAEAEADLARRRLEQEEARANALSDAAMAARRDLIAARAEVEELRARTAEPVGSTIHDQVIHDQVIHDQAIHAQAIHDQAAAAADEARLVAEKTVDASRQALAEERERSEQLAGALAEARRRVAVLETAAEAAQVAHQAQAQNAARERAMMRAGLRRLAVALRAAQVAQSEAAAREVQAAGARDRAEQGRLAAERTTAETRGRLDRLKAGRDRDAEASIDTAPQRPSLVLQTRPGPAPRGGAAWTAPRPTAAPDTLDEERLLVQAAALLGRGDISGARLFLTLGVRSGSARATALLAETYDPDRLAALQVRGLRGDPETASALYRQAQQNRGGRQPDLASRDPAATPPAGLGPQGPAGWTSPVRQAGLPGPFVPPLAAPWGGE
ncbi:hypothetical protein [Methylobacterium sp. SyP6R]|uniref:hypothetical protein n=1 Tax=Methylobacterium sp. SyP6R TaxID=2718876 RepID=UPI001F1D0A0B|nr:hypothetical protein [Methylobacterium sp. SyP6R]MCF4125788.1 hypothetical protein [Methylobacterium sp. SyP6R]